MCEERDVVERLADIAIALKHGADPADFQEELDRLLDTSMTERDEAQESAWEQAYRRGGNE